MPRSFSLCLLRLAPLAAVLLVCGAAAAEKPSPERPNVLLIMTDDQGWGDVRSHGNPNIDTPVLDGLAESGARFERFFVSPVCAPTRASLLTGRYHLRGGVHGVTRGEENLRSEEVTLAELLRDAGYATGCFGKWHNGAHWPYHPNGQGFEEFLGFCGGHWNNYFDTELEHNGEPHQLEGFIIDDLTTAALKFIDKNKEQNWFCYVPFNTPHTPWQVPDKYWAKYQGRGLDAETACAYAMCENIDDNLGRLLAHLEETGLAENTLVLFLTDNGPNGDRYNGDMKGRKGSIDEGGSRVPLFMRLPTRIEPGLVVKPIAAHIDLLPTIIDLCGLHTPENLALDGTSLRPLLEQEKVEWPDRTLFTYRGKGERGAARTQQWRAVLNGNKWELYDMQADPSQRNNVAAENAEVVERLSSAYVAGRLEMKADALQPLPVPLGYAERPFVVLPAHEAILDKVAGEGIRYFGTSGWCHDWIAGWTDPHATAHWNLAVKEAGKYEAVLLYACPEADAGARLALEAGESRLEATIAEANDSPTIPRADRIRRKEVYEREWKRLPLGTLALAAGESKLVLRPIAKTGDEMPQVKAVELRRVD